MNDYIMMDMKYDQYNGLTMKERGILDFNKRLLKIASKFNYQSIYDKIYHRLLFANIFDSNMEEFFSVRSKIFNNEEMIKEYLHLLNLRDMILELTLKDIKNLYRFETMIYEDDKEELFNKIKNDINVIEIKHKLKVSEIEYYPMSIQLVIENKVDDIKILVQIKENVELNIYKVNNHLYRYQDVILKYIEENYIDKFPEGLEIDDIKYVFFRTTFCELGPTFKYNSKDYLKDMYEYIIDKKCNRILSKVESSSSLSMISLYNKIGTHPVLSVSTKFVYYKDILNFIKQFVDTRFYSSILSSKRNYSNIPTFDQIMMKDKYIDQIKKEDKIIDFPHDKFDMFLDILKEAANDDNVESIYLNIYRIGKSENLSNVLKYAISKNKIVKIHCELNARFDELMNIYWASDLINHGVQVYFYRPREIKIHSKCTLIKYKNGDMLSIVGTGNYNESTSSMYTDLMLLTFDNDIGVSVNRYFEMIFKNRSPKLFKEETKENPLNDFYMSKINLRTEIINNIREETLKENKGLIRFKCNSFDDPLIIDELNIAANNGVKIQLLVRGYCGWNPDKKYLNSNQVEIRSIIWEYLEHSRIYLFGNNDNFYIGSIDLLQSKLNNRIETMVKVKQNNVKRYLNNYFNDYWNNFKNNTFKMEFKNNSYVYSLI